MALAWPPVFCETLKSDTYIESQNAQITLPEATAVEIHLRFLYSSVVETCPVTCDPSRGSCIGRQVPDRPTACSVCSCDPGVSDTYRSLRHPHMRRSISCRVPAPRFAVHHLRPSLRFPEFLSSPQRKAGRNDPEIGLSPHRASWNFRV